MPPGTSRPSGAAADFPRSGLAVAIIVEFALERGVSPSEVLAGTGLRTPELLAADTVVSAHQEMTAVRNLAVRLGHPPHLGVELGRYYRVTTLGPYGYACLTAPTIGAALGVALEFWELTYGFGTLEAEVVEQNLYVRYLDHGIPEDVRPLIVERDLLAAFSVVGELAGRPVRPREVRLSYPAPAHTDGLTRILGVAPRFEQPSNSVSFPLGVLDQSLPHADPDAHARFVEQCRGLLARRRDTSAAELVRELRARLAGAGGTPSFEELAERAAISPRTLRRRLAAAGTSYRVLLDQARHAAADRLLAETGDSVEEIAVRLGYAEAASFIHAYKRWTGTTPARRRADFVARRNRLR